MTEQPHHLPQPVPPYAMADEISLRDLFRSIYDQRATLLLVWGVILAAALGYALLAKPSYRAEAHLLPPLPQDIQPLNLPARVTGSGNIASFSSSVIYDELQKNLNSRALRLAYFREQQLFAYYRAEVGLAEELMAFELGFNQALQVEVPKEGDQRFVTIGFEHGDREAAARLLDSFVQHAAASTVAELIATVDNSLAVRRQELETRIAGMREFAAERRRDRIIVLREAHRIASQLGIREGMTGGRAASAGEGGVAVNTAQLPLYTRGSLALGAEIDALQARESDDPFIAGLRDLQEQLARLTVAAIEAGTVRPLILDQAAHAPEKPVRPKRLLIVIGGFIAGLFLGVIAALLRAQLAGSED